MERLLNYSEMANYVTAVFEKMYHEGDLTKLSLSEIADINSFGPDGGCTCCTNLMEKQNEVSSRLFDLALKVDEEQFERSVLNLLVEVGIIGRNEPDKI
ncbi:MAG: hypothetical protein ACRC3H_07620 [Lachnospiraceae bacterium]